MRIPTLCAYWRGALGTNLWTTLTQSVISILVEIIYFLFEFIREIKALTESFKDTYMNLIHQRLLIMFLNCEERGVVCYLHSLSVWFFFIFFFWGEGCLFVCFFF